MSILVPPKNLATASVQPRQIVLTWSHPLAGITGFRLMRSLDRGTTWIEQARLPLVLSHLATGLIPGQTYLFRIQAVHAPTNRESAWTLLPVPVNTPQVAPAAPTNLRVVSATPTGGVLQWTDASDNEHLFVIESSTNGGKTWVRQAETAANATTVTLSTLLPGTGYQVRVVARNNIGSAASNGCPLNTLVAPPRPPATPTNLSAQNITTSGFDLTWSDQSPNELGFVVELSRDLGGSWQKVGETGPNVVRLAVSGLTPETRFVVRVLARNNAGLSAPSTTLEVETLGFPPAPPDELRVLADTLTATSVELAWRDNSANEQEFVIQRLISGSTPWESVGLAAANVTTFKATGLTPMTDYQFRVRARNRHGASADSAPVSVQTRGLPPNRPEKLRIENLRARMLDLLWNDCSHNEQEFVVLCSTNDGPFVPVGLAARDSTRLTVCDLLPLTRYCFQVKARNADGDSDFTPALCVQTPGEAPSPPTQFELKSRTATSATLAWVDTSTDEVDFALFASLDQGLNYTHLSTFPANSNRADIGLLKPNQRYLLRLQARNSWGGSPFAGPLDFVTPLAPPATPQRLQAVAVSAERIDLAWVLEDTSATSLLVDISEDQGLTWQFKVSVPGNYRQCGIIWINSGTTYAFRIRATNAAGESSWSNVASATTPETRPIRPRDLRAEHVTATTIDLCWTDVSQNESEFLIQVSDQQGLVWSTVGVTAANVVRFQARGLTPATDYQFRVIARNAVGSSDPTPPCPVRTNAPPPAPPTGFTAVQIQARQVELAWVDASDNETQFELVYSLDDGANYSLFKTIPPNTQRETITRLTPATRYVFKLRALNAAGASPFTSPLSLLTAPEPPAVPGKPGVVTPGSRTLELAWFDNSTNEVDFRVESSRDGRAWSEQGVTPANTPRLQVTGLQPLTEYWFRVQARNAAGASGFSESLVMRTTGEPPAAPSDLTCSEITQTSANLAWSDRSPDEETFEVEISTPAGSSWQPYRSVPVNTTRLPLAGLLTGTDYACRVVARNAWGRSVPSGSVQFRTLGPVPPRPVLALGPVGILTVDLTWTDDGATETGFELARSDDQGRTWTILQRLPQDVTRTQVTGLAPDTPYLFRIEAVNGSGGSGPSNEVQVRTLPRPPAAPSQLTVTGPSRTSLQLAWSDNSLNETRFEIEFSSDGGANFLPLGSTELNVTRFSVGSLACGRPYTFRVRAINPGGNSDWSAPASGTTLPCLPSSPTDLKGTPSPTVPTSALVEWQPGPAGGPVDGYRLAWNVTGATAPPTVLELPGSARSCPLSPLALDTRYDLQLLAFNAGGTSANNPTASFATRPNPPLALQVTGETSNSLLLVWSDNNRTAVGFRLQSSTSDGRTWISLPLPQGTSFNSCRVESLQADTPYQFRLTAFNAAGDSPPVEARGRTLPTTPRSPERLQITSVAPTAVGLEWVDQSDNEQGFDLYRSDDGRESWQFARTTDAGVTRVTDTGLTPETQYWFRVLARSQSASSPPSNEIDATTPLPLPDAATGVCAHTKSSTSLAVEWAHAGVYVKEFIIYRSTDQKNWSEAARLAGSLRCGVIDGLHANTSYWVKVVAYNATGNSPDSNIASGKTAVPAPAPVGSLRVTAATPSSITLAWNPADGWATAFQVDLSRDGGGGWSVVGQLGAGSSGMEVTGLSPDRSYTFRVTARNSSGDSTAVTVSGQTPPAPPASPVNVGYKSLGNIKVTLTWQNVATTAVKNLIRMSTDGSNFTSIAELPFQATEHTVTNLRPGTRYWFMVYSVSPTSWSPPLTPLQITTTNRKPTPITNLRAINIGVNTVDLTWDGGEGEEGYEFQLSENSPNSWRGCGSTGPNIRQFRVNNLKAKTWYRFKVRAVNTVGATDWCETSGSMSTKPR